MAPNKDFTYYSPRLSYGHLVLLLPVLLFTWFWWIGMIESIIMGRWPFWNFSSLFPYAAYFLGVIFSGILVKMLSVVSRTYFRQYRIGIPIVLLCVAISAMEIVAVIIWTNVKTTVPLVYCDDFRERHTEVINDKAWIRHVNETAIFDTLSLPIIFRNDSFEVFGIPETNSFPRLLKPWIGGYPFEIDKNWLCPQNFHAWVPNGFKSVSKDSSERLISFFSQQFPGHNLVVRKKEYLGDKEKSLRSRGYLTIWHTLRFIPSHVTILEDFKSTGIDFYKDDFYSLALVRRARLVMSTISLLTASPENSDQSHAIFAEWRGQPSDSVGNSWLDYVSDDIVYEIPNSF